MRATAIRVHPEFAEVTLEPCWLARWFGALTLVVELQWRKDSLGNWHWYATGSRRKLDDLPHAALIRNALDFQPRAVLPDARLRGVS